MTLSDGMMIFTSRILFFPPGTLKSERCAVASSVSRLIEERKERSYYTVLSLTEKKKTGEKAKEATDG